MAAKTDQWVRIFEVPETKRHNKGHTIYQVKSTVFPRSSPEASTSVVVWRRYSELRRLHKSITELHQKLGLSEQLPSFPRASLLNRFDAEVIEARRQAALNLLKFIGQHSSLFTSESFTKFFENEESVISGKKRKEISSRKTSKGRSKESEHLASTLGIQGLSSLYSQMSDTEDEFSVCSSLDSPISPDPAAPLFPNEQDFFSATEPLVTEVTKNGEDEVAEHKHNSAETKPNFSESTIHGVLDKPLSQILTSQQSRDTISVDDKISKDKPRPDRKGYDSEWNFIYDSNIEEDVFKYDSGIQNTPQSDRDHTLSDRHASTSSMSSVSSQPFCVYENPVHDSPKQHQRPYPAEDVLKSQFVTASSERGPIRPVPPINVSRRISIAGRKNSVPLTPLTPLTQTVLPIVPKSKVPSPQEVASSQYIFVAAQQISEAQHHEQQKEYKQALNMYREGVGTLLQGVQGDTDNSRREAVRRKTAQYLHRAEQLVARLTRKDKRKDQDYIDGIGVEAKDGGEPSLRFQASDLKKYRVAGSTGSVIIATDTTNGDTVAIKVLIKSGVGSGEKTIVPQNVPFMVPIIRYHETDSAIYLVLKFISGGKLWSHISKYVSEVYSDVGDLYDASSENTYAGRRLLVENAECDVSAAADSSSICETPSLVSNVSSQKSNLLPPPSTGNLLTVPGRNSVGGCSTCSDASSSCMPDGYLPIYTEYSPGLPSSSSMVVIPPVGNLTTQVTDCVHKSISAGALIMEVSECIEERSLVEKNVVKACSHSASCERNNIEDPLFVAGINEEVNGDNVSIGSDTLSGVSEDFSCSLPPNVPALLPDPLPLPEVKVTSYTTDGRSVRSYCRETKLEGCTDEPVCPVERDTVKEQKVNLADDRDLCDIYKTCDNVEVSLVNTVKGTDVVKRLDAGSPDAHLKVDDDKDDISFTDTSFASVTLPSFSWTKKEDSELASLDIEDLIRNSKKLLQNVDHTLQQSKTQSVATFHDSDDSASVEHSELPYDGVNMDVDQFDRSKGGNKMVKSNPGKQSECAAVKQTTSVYDTSAAHLEIDVLNHQVKKNKGHCRVKSDTAVAQLKAIGIECVGSIKNVDGKDGIEKSGESLMPISTTDVCDVDGLGSQSLQKTCQTVCSNKSSPKDRLSPVTCGEPLENSIGTLLEQYSANRGQDIRPRLPEGIVKIWSSQIISAMTSLHQLGIIWGDFSPDNVLLDEGGSILVTYESRWSSVQHDIRGGKGWNMMNGESGNRWKGYLAPELESPLAYPSAASDWWSVGAIMYHMLTGKCVSAAHPSGTTSHTELSLPAHLSPEASSLLLQLLCAHPTERLGGCVAGAQEIKDHAFFTGIQWTE